MIVKDPAPFSGAKVFAIMGTRSLDGAHPLVVRAAGSPLWVALVNRRPSQGTGQVHAVGHPVYPFVPDRTVWQRGLAISKSYLHIDTIGFERHDCC